MQRTPNVRSGYLDESTILAMPPKGLGEKLDARPCAFVVKLGNIFLRGVFCKWRHNLDAHSLATRTGYAPLR
jgi:hypothetical protein